MFARSVRRPAPLSSRPKRFASSRIQRKLDRVQPRPLDTISPIDCHHMSKKDYVYSYLLVEGSQAAFIENNTSHAIPALLRSLEQRHLTPAQVRYIIVTHAHLDNAGATSLLADKCPNATVLAHPRAVPHLIDPHHLIQQGIDTYGQTSFYKFYGDVLPVSPDRIRAVQDEELVHLESRPLLLFHTPGHADHHLSIFDPSTKSVFPGDAFGTSYLSTFLAHRVPQNQTQLTRLFGLSDPSPPDSSRNFLFPSSPPDSFDLSDSHLSVDRIASTGAEHAFLTHCGLWRDLPMGALQMHHGLQAYQKILQNALSKMRTAQHRQVGLEKYELLASVEKDLHTFFSEELQQHGIQHSPPIRDLLQLDLELNAQGLLLSAKKLFLKTGGQFYFL